MSKLYPPIIDAVLPAMYEMENEIICEIPFHINSAVSIADIKTLSLKIKTISSNRNKSIIINDCYFEYKPNEVQ
jgi:hypothetical protein